MKANNHSLDIEALKWRLAETMTWCMRNGSITDASSAAVKLRTPELCPSGFVYSTDEYGYSDMEPSLGVQETNTLIKVVDEVARLRVEQLNLSNIYPLVPAEHLAGGKLLCYAPFENLAEGVEEQETQGYFDVRAVPPWDTWLWFSTQKTQRRLQPHGQGYWYDAYLISWVPPEFVAIVDEGGRSTSTTFALAWADELDSELLTQLRAANIPT